MEVYTLHMTRCTLWSTVQDSLDHDDGAWDISKLWGLTAPQKITREKISLICLNSEHHEQWTIEIFQECSVLWPITRAIKPSKQTRKPETIISCTTAPTFFFFFVTPRSLFSSPHDNKIISIILLVPSGTTADQWGRRLWYDQCCQHPPFYIIIIHLNVT